MSINVARTEETPVESISDSEMARTEVLAHPASALCDTRAETTSSPINASMNQQFSLIPLHPAAKRTKLDIKQFPIVMGRTNLAAWWWRSCPCQHYCRLHCRPVAQNIRSLSKVMIQVDTAGHVHVVGKNPHLITITPDRGDSILQLNDIISIGRRDREPWMRFQVIQKPEGNAPEESCSRRHSSGISKMDKAPPGNEWLGTLPPAPSLGLAVPSTLRHLQSKDNNRPVVDPALPNRKIIRKLPRNVDISTTPPEWITTNTRKRHSDRTNSSHIATSKISTPVERVQDFQHSCSQNSVPVTNLPRTSNTYNPTSNPQWPVARKRRRQSLESMGGGNSRPKRSAYKGNQQGSSDKASVGTGASPHGDNCKRDHLHVHLVFQDYQTSAILLQDNERKRKSESIVHPNCPMETAPIPDVSRHPPGTIALQENVTTVGLLSAAYPSTIPDTTTTPAPQQAPCSNSTAVDSKIIKSTRRSLFLASSEELSVPVPAAKDCTATASSPGLAPSKETWNTGEEDIEASMLSLPQCASSNLEEGQRSFPVKSSPKDQVAASTKHDDDEYLEDESVSSPPSCDPIMDLKPWQDMIQQEEEKGNAKSFRHALASLIVAKNQDRVGTEGKRGLLWLPPLLGDDFKIDGGRS